MANNLTMNNVDTVLCIRATPVGVFSTLVASQMWPLKNFVIVDKPLKIQKWDSQNLQHYEPGLQQMIVNRTALNVDFVVPNNNHQIANYHQLINAAQIIIIAADNKLKNYGLGKRKRLDLNDWDRDMRKVLVQANAPKIIIMKSQMEPDFARTALDNTINSCRAINPVAEAHHIFWVPEFYSAGTAFQNLTNPTRVLISPCYPVAPNIPINIALIQQFYTQPGWVQNNQIITAAVSNGIMGTMGSNIVLALKGIMMNMMADLCEEMPNYDIEEILGIMRTDPRTNGNPPPRVSAGVGGPALIRDLEFFSHLAQIHEKKGMVAFFRGVIRSNIEHQQSVISKILKCVNGLKGKAVGILGFSYKEDTGYVINSAAIEICRKLISEKAKQIKIYDSEVQENDIRACFRDQGKIMVVNNLNDLWLHCEVLCFLQTKPEFNNPINWQHVYNRTQIQMQGATEPRSNGEVHLFDTCNVLWNHVANIRQVNLNNNVTRFRINRLGHPQLI